MKEIPLTQGKVALVDDEDYEKLSKYKWFAEKNGSTYYAKRHLPTINNNRPFIKMHVAILNPPQNTEVDHINGNGLDNRRSNLRAVSHRVNCQNRHHPKTSKYPGVSWDAQNKKWVAQIQIEGKSNFLGRFEEELLAANAYNHVCKHPEDAPEPSKKIKTSKYFGVCWDKTRNKWMAYTRVDGKRLFFGRFDDEDCAGNAVKTGVQECPLVRVQRLKGTPVEEFKTGNEAKKE